MRTLASKEIVTIERVEVHEPGGSEMRFLYRGGRVFLGEGDGYERAPGFAMAAGRVDGKSVAWIGGGFCIGPRVFAIANCRQTVYEIEPSLVEFCPPGVDFIPGDWRNTLTGTYDVIIYDTGGDIPRDELAKHLNPGGTILPKKEA